MSFTNTLYYAFFAAGLGVGFGHCIGMCGPIVVSLSLNLKEKNGLVPHLFYTAGRLTTYGLMGGLMGATGSFAGVISRIAGLQKGVMIFAGILIMVMGLAMSGWIPFGRIFGNSYSPQGPISRGFRKLSAAAASGAYYPLGLLLGWLPCGPVYTGLVAAASAGMETGGSVAGFVTGMGLMLAFGIGTAPSLFLASKLASLRWIKYRTVFYKISSGMMVLVGIYFLVKAIGYE